MKNREHTHYHVFAGTVGCLQDGDATFKTLAEAKRYMQEMAGDYKDAGYRVTGSALRLRYDIDPINYLEIQTCSDPECELWKEFATEE